MLAVRGLQEEVLDAVRRRGLHQPPEHDQPASSKSHRLAQQLASYGSSTDEATRMHTHTQEEIEGQIKANVKTLAVSAKKSRSNFLTSLFHLITAFPNEI